MGETRWRRRYSSVLRDVGLPEPFDLDLFCRNIARSRGRPLRLHQLPSEVTGYCGLCVELPTVDHVFFSAGTSPLHQQHIVLHELAHLLFGHGGRPGMQGIASDAVEALLPGLDAALIQTALGRHGYSDPEEREAETLASLILDHAGRVGASGVTADAAARIETAFG